jgi:hypothetical protein
MIALTLAISAAVATLIVVRRIRVNRAIERNVRRVMSRHAH